MNWELDVFDLPYIWDTESGLQIAEILVCDADDDEPYATQDQNEAMRHGRLIAAAPDMQKALEHALHALNHDEFPETVAVIEAALNKSKGQ